MTKYIAKYLQLKLINKASYTKEVEGRIVVVSGKSIQFEDGVYKTNDKDEIAFLDNHPNCGSVFVKVKDKDLSKARAQHFKSGEEKRIEEETKVKEKEKEAKALEEGSELPKTKKGKSKKAEKPKF